MRGDDSDICPVDGCRADIADSRLVAVGPARSRDPRTEPVVVCENDHETIV
jgi:hypothetical protein